MFEYILVLNNKVMAWTDKFENGVDAIEYFKKCFPGHQGIVYLRVGGQ